MYYAALFFTLFAVGALSNIDQAQASNGLASALPGFVCQTEFSEDSGLYSIDVGIFTRGNVRHARLVSFGDGKLKDAGGATLTQKSGSFTTEGGRTLSGTIFQDIKADVYIAVSDTSNSEGLFIGVARAGSVSNLEYRVTCKEKIFSIKIQRHKGIYEERNIFANVTLETQAL